MVKIQPLQWDSEFFNLRIGKAIIEFYSDFTSLIEQEKQLRGMYDLIYVFSAEKIARIADVDYNFVLVDEKTIYEMDVISSETQEDVCLYSDNQPNKELYQLALISGAYSRFKLDKNFPENSFEKLYYRWIEESVNGNMADAVFVHNSANSIDGMITVKWNNECADIGLVAVETNTQGKGVGSALMKHLHAYLKQNTTVKRISVATQWQNIKARNWYEKNGFQVKSVTNLYHWWLLNH